MPQQSPNSSLRDNSHTAIATNRQIRRAAARGTERDHCFLASSAPDIDRGQPRRTEARLQIHAR